MGANLFIATGVAEVRLEDLIRKIVPFIITMIIMLMMVTFIPQLSLWLPSMME
ncbi:MAG: TRAP transporter large permease subunit [Succinivibrio sp.]